MRGCASPQALADLVLASSCTPPFTPLLAQGGCPALDGGLTDNVPVAAVERADGPTLVLLARRYARKLSHLPAHVVVSQTPSCRIFGRQARSPAAASTCSSNAGR